jgi:4-amino-4-deoxy-L-arabinose transferase-like glycosyltransferase
MSCTNNAGPVRGWAIRGAAAAALAAAYLAVAALAPPLDDELYYWCWAQDLQPSYFDHPPMTAYLIRASTALFGDSVLALRLPAVLANLGVLTVAGRLTRPRRYLGWAMTTPLFTLGAVLITPDAILLLFWALYLGWLAAVHRRLAPAAGDPRPVPVWLWLVGGLALGGAGLSKYTAGLLVPSGLASFLLAGPPPWRRWVPGYLLHGMVAGAAVLPVLVFNAQHDFAPLLFQWRHMTAASRTGLAPLVEFVGVQIALMGTAPLVLLPWAWRHARILAADPDTRAGLSLYAIPLTFFVGKAVLGPVQPNWPIVCYVGFWPVAARWYAGWARTPARRAAAAAAYAVPLLATLVVTAHLIHPLPVVSPAKDRIGAQAARHAAARRAAEAIRATGENLPVYTATYQSTARLRYHGVRAQQIAGITRPSNFTLNASRLADADQAFVVHDGPWPVAVAGFGPAEVVWSEPLVVRGQAVGYTAVFRYTRERGLDPQPSP